jgi:hypothetical protein
LVVALQSRLPPDLVGPDDEHAKMLAIGESDRMTLKLVKRWWARRPGRR